MKFQLFIFIIGLLNIISTDGRLIQKNKTRNVEEAQTEKPNPSIRLTRDIENDSLTGFSKESAQSEEFIKSYNKRARYFYKTPKTQPQKKTRIARDSMENRKVDKTKTKKVYEEQNPTKTKSMVVLVKAPIPKFYEIDSDDFQSKISNSHIIADSGDHEDEDFNLEDYDFDINHDEFNSGRKPLEPRISTKNAVADDKKPEMKIITKLPVSVKPKPISAKKERAAELPSKTLDNAKEFDYYDDTTTTKSTKKVTKALDDEYDENYDNIELHKNNSGRNIRSWNVNLFGDKFNDRVSKIMTKLLDVLPLFPMMHDSYEIEDNPDSSDVIAEPITITARHLFY